MHSVICYLKQCFECEKRKTLFQIAGFCESNSVTEQEKNIHHLKNAYYIQLQLTTDLQHI